jgi:lia operon protein LiaG
MFNKDNMRRIVLYLIATVFISYGAGTAMLMSSTKGDFSSITFSSAASSGKSVTVNQEKQENIDSIDEIYVEASSSKINIITENRKDVKAQLTGNISSPSLTMDPELEVSISGSRLDIKVKIQNTYWGPTTINLKLDVYLPADYTKNLKLRASSGSISVDNIKLSSLDCSLSSGSLKLANAVIDNFQYKVSSGSLSANELITKSSNLTSSSGSIKIGSFTGDLKARASSGNIKVNYKKFDNHIDITASSGTIELTLPEDSEFSLVAKASSGTVSCKFPISIHEKSKNNYLEGVFKSDNNKIVLNTSSGNIKVLR